MKGSSTLPPIMGADETDTLSALDRLRERRGTIEDQALALIDAREAVRTAFEARDAAEKDEEKPSEEERAAYGTDEQTFKREFVSFKEQIAELDTRIDAEELKERRLEHASQAGRTDVSITHEPHTYREDNGKQVSYFRDLAYTQNGVAQHMGGNSADALERLQRHAKETETWLPQRAAARDRRAQARLDEAERAFTGSFAQGVGRRGLDASPFERRVTPNRTDGQGGYFVPPEWLVDEYIPGLRAGRVAAGLCRQMDLPPGTDSINIPKLSTLTKVAPQASDNAPVASQDFTDTVVTANVKTLAGQEDVAIQLLEQSPGQIVDRVIMEDLLADYNRLVDQMVIYGSGTGASSLNAGQISGLYPSTNWTTNTVTWNSTGITGGGFLSVMNANASRIAYNRFDLQNVRHLMHPRRWFWYASALDGASGTSGRPYVNVPSHGLYNQATLEAENLPFEGLAGSNSSGQDILIDGNVPITDNGSGLLTGTNDVLITGKWDDAWLFEGDLRTRVLPEILSGVLAIRFQVYNYLAFLLRYGQSFTLAQGNGFAAPTSLIDTSVTF